MNLRHDNIVQLIGVCCSVRPLCILTEFFEKGSLKKCLEVGSVPTDNIDVLFDICIQMVSALVYLESFHFILHRDLCARNFLVTDDMLIKLSSFERAREIIDDNYQASPTDDIIIKWAAPEVILNSCYSTKSDVWSLGVVFWEVFSHGAEPYSNLREEKVTSFIIEGGRLDKPPGCSHDIYSMMKCCWHASPEERPSFSTLSDKIKGKSSVYYVSPIRSASTPSANKSPVSADNPRTLLPLPVKVKSPTTNHIRPVTSSSSSTTQLPIQRDSHHQIDNYTSIKNGSSMSERTPTSSSETSSIISSSILNDHDKDDLTRTDKIRKSLRKLIKKKTPSIAVSQHTVKHT